MMIDLATWRLSEKAVSMLSFRGTEGDVGHANGVIKKVSFMEGYPIKRITTSS
jgi:hypothetical protein